MLFLECFYKLIREKKHGRFLSKEHGVWQEVAPDVAKEKIVRIMHNKTQARRESFGKKKSRSTTKTWESDKLDDDQKEVLPSSKTANIE